MMMLSSTRMITSSLIGPPQPAVTVTGPDRSLIAATHPAGDQACDQAAISGAHDPIDGARRVTGDAMSQGSYLLAGQDGELDRLQHWSRMSEPAGRRLLGELGDGQGARALDVGCGALGWLRLLSEWVGPDGQVVGTDMDQAMLAAAGRFVTAEGLGNVTLLHDDVFASELQPSSFDLVHARAMIFPLGRGQQQLASHLRLVRPGGTVVLEEVDTASLHHLPPAPAFDRLKPLVVEAFRKAGGDPDAAATQLELFRAAGIEPNVRAEIQALPPGHPGLQQPLQFVAALDGVLRSLVDPEELERLREQAERELRDPGRWGLDFTLVQVWGQRRI
jgi:SAM-dependent methyltransferase